MGVAAKLFGWRPWEFLRATPHEFWAAFEIHEEAAGDGGGR